MNYILETYFLFKDKIAASSKVNVSFQLAAFTKSEQIQKSTLLLKIKTYKNTFFIHDMLASSNE